MFEYKPPAPVVVPSLKPVSPAKEIPVSKEIFLSIDGTSESAKDASGEAVKKVGSCTIYKNQSGFFVKTNTPLSGRHAWAGYFTTIGPAERVASYAGMILSALA
jgi:hypothetical protein